MSSPAAKLARLFFEEVVDEPSGPPPKLVSLRVPPMTLARIDSMADHTGLSRNALLLELIDVGTSYTLGELPDELREGLELDTANRFRLFEEGAL